MSVDITITPIGVVRSARTDRRDTPVQSALNPSEEATVELDPRYLDALDGLDGFDYAWLLTWLGLGDEPAEPVALRQVPYLLTGAQRELGILATRGPRRINPIGLHLVQLVSIDGARIRFAGVDIVDRTPVIDIKPYVVAFDRPAEPIRSGWFDSAELPTEATPRQLGSG